MRTGLLRVLRREYAGCSRTVFADEEEHSGCQQPSEQRADNPRGDDVPYTSPVHSPPSLGHHSDPDDSTNARVRGGDWQLVVRGEDEPNARAKDHGQHPNQQLVGRGAELVKVGDALANRARHVRTEEDGAAELEDRCDDDGVLVRHSAAADRRGESICDVVGADTEAREKCEATSHRQRP